MDDLIRDPDLGPSLFKVLKDKLEETRKALDSAKQESEAFQTEIEELRRAQNVERKQEKSLGYEVERLELELENAEEVNRRLEEENRDLRDTVEDLRNRETTENKADGSEWSVEEWSEEPRPTKDVLAEVERELAHVKDELDDRNAAYEELQRSAEERRELLTQKEAALQTTQGRLNELRQQFNAQRIAADEKEIQLRQELDATTQKYWKYKNLYEEMKTAQQEAAARRAAKQLSTEQGALVTTSASRRSSDAVVATHSADTVVADSSSKNLPWYEIVGYVLLHPCFPLITPSAPFHLPPHVKSLLGVSTILSCPNRIMYPYSEGFARLVAPQQHCTGSTTPLEFSPPTNELAAMVGCPKEMFFYSPTGICYAGTFVGVEVGEVSRAEYSAFSKPMKEAIVKHTFPSKSEYTAAVKIDVDRLRNWYMAGKAKAQYLSLKYVGYNKPFFNAMMGLGAMDGNLVGPVASKRSAAEFVAGSASKRPRLVSE